MGCPYLYMLSICINGHPVYYKRNIINFLLKKKYHIIKVIHRVIFPQLTK